MERFITPAYNDTLTPKKDSGPWRIFLSGPTESTHHWGSQFFNIIQEKNKKYEHDLEVHCPDSIWIPLNRDALVRWRQHHLTYTHSAVFWIPQPTHPEILENFLFFDYYIADVVIELLQHVPLFETYNGRLFSVGMDSECLKVLEKGRKKYPQSYANTCFTIIENEEVNFSIETSAEMLIDTVLKDIKE